MRFLISVLLILEPTSSPPPPPLVEGAGSMSYWVQVATIAVPIITLLAFLPSMVLHLKTYLDKSYVKKRLGAKAYTEEVLKEAFRYFVPPKCHPTDLSNGGGAIDLNGCKYLFDDLDDRLSRPGSYRYLILLGDSGMGKTTALLNYFARHYRFRRLKRLKFDLALVPLHRADSESLIASITDRDNTVLLLDALDENIMAIVHPGDCLRLLLEATEGFRCVLISCRTHFFSKDEEIPVETGVSKPGPRVAGDPPEYSFQRIYLLPFSDEQVKRYLSRRYRFRRGERKKVLEMIRLIPHLSARPMLLAYTPYLVREKKTYRCSYDLYEAMVNGWLTREALIKDPATLKEFSELLAVDIHLNRPTRKSETIPRDELMGLVEKWNFKIEDWKLSGRSLLNRDTEGNYKFADATIMEYLFVSRFLRGDPATLDAEWTEQMHVFHWEKVLRYWEEEAGPWFMREPLELLLEHPNGIDTLVSSHAVCSRKAIVDFETEKWDEFGVSLIAYIIYVTTDMASSVLFGRINEVTFTKTFGEQRIKFECSHSSVSNYRNEYLFHGSYGTQTFPVYDYKGEFDAVELGEGEAAKELPEQVANSLFAKSMFHAMPYWINRAFRVHTGSGADIIMAFQTTAPVEAATVDKITRCAEVLF